VQRVYRYTEASTHNIGAARSKVSAPMGKMGWRYVEIGLLFLDINYCKKHVPCEHATKPHECTSETLGIEGSYLGRDNPKVFVCALVGLDRRQVIRCQYSERSGEETFENVGEQVEHGRKSVSHNFLSHRRSILIRHFEKKKRRGLMDMRILVPNSYGDVVSCSCSFASCNKPALTSCG